ncbi:MAG TPA: homoserine dehydrogenase, partial [Clostridiales bacterium]|nr:homoserine dehydrogenase [Clostridiales bacterium]
MEKIYIGLLGLGTVGTGFLKTLEMNQDKIQKELGKELVVKRILVNNVDKKRDIDISNYALTNKFDDILYDKD